MGRRRVLVVVLGLVAAVVLVVPATGRPVAHAVRVVVDRKARHDVRVVSRREKADRRGIAGLNSRVSSLAQAPPSQGPAGPPGPPGQIGAAGPSGTQTSGTGVYEVEFHALSNTAGTTFFNTGKFALRGVCTGAGASAALSVEVITNVDHASFSSITSTGTGGSATPTLISDFQVGAPQNILGVGRGMGSLTYTEVGGEKVTMNFISLDGTATGAAAGSPTHPGPYGGSTQVACLFDGTANVIAA